MLTPKCDTCGAGRFIHFFSTNTSGLRTAKYSAMVALLRRAVIGLVFMVLCAGAIASSVDAELEVRV